MRTNWAILLLSHVPSVYSYACFPENALTSMFPRDRAPQAKSTYERQTAIAARIALYVASASQVSSTELKDNAQVHGRSFRQRVLYLRLGGSRGSSVSVCILKTPQLFDVCILAQGEQLDAHRDTFCNVASVALRWIEVSLYSSMNLEARDLFYLRKGVTHCEEGDVERSNEEGKEEESLELNLIDWMTSRTQTDMRDLDQQIAADNPQKQCLGASDTSQIGAGQLLAESTKPQFHLASRFSTLLRTLFLLPVLIKLEKYLQIPTKQNLLGDFLSSILVDCKREMKSERDLIDQDDNQDNMEMIRSWALYALPLRYSSVCTENEGEGQYDTYDLSSSKLCSGNECEVDSLNERAICNILSVLYSDSDLMSGDVVTMTKLGDSFKLITISVHKFKESELEAKTTDNMDCCLVTTETFPTNHHRFHIISDEMAFNSTLYPCSKPNDTMSQNPIVKLEADSLLASGSTFQFRVVRVAPDLNSAHDSKSSNSAGYETDSIFPTQTSKTDQSELSRNPSNIPPIATTLFSSSSRKDSLESLRENSQHLSNTSTCISNNNYNLNSTNEDPMESNRKSISNGLLASYWIPRSCVNSCPIELYSSLAPASLPRLVPIGIPDIHESDPLPNLISYVLFYIKNRITRLA